MKNKIQSPFYPEPFATKEEAINRAKELEQIKHSVCVLQSSPTTDGKQFYVEPSDTMVRTWESVIYSSKF